MGVRLRLSLLLRLLLPPLLVAVSLPTPEDFLIGDLPGLEGAALNFKQYAGYMPLGDEAGTEMFFWFVESQNDPSSDPVAFWTNGGPGSSSVAYGFWTEHGPFRLKRNSSGTVIPELYQYSWNRNASIVYLEMPTGVGFSRSNSSLNYENITDEQSAYESHQFLKNFFQVFSSFTKNPFFLTGESYGGHYVPNLAEKLIDEPLGIDMKGFLIGNPGINSDWYYNVNEYAFITYLWSHGLLPAKEYMDAHVACKWEEFFSDCDKDFTHPSDECVNATGAALELLPKPLDFYDVLVTTCHDNLDNNRDTSPPARQHVPFMRHLNEKYGLDIDGYDPCINNLTPEYINQPEVLAAIHADKHVIDREWPSTPDNWAYNQGSAGEKKDIATIFPKFFEKAPEWKIWVVSGTADSAVPLLGTERWMNCLGRKNLGSTQ